MSEIKGSFLRNKASVVAYGDEKDAIAFSKNDRKITISTHLSSSGEFDNPDESLIA